MENKVIEAIYLSVSDGEIAGITLDLERDDLVQKEFMEKYFDRTDINGYIDAESDLSGIAVANQEIGFEAGFRACLMLMANKGVS